MVDLKDKHIYMPPVNTNMKLFDGQTTKELIDIDLNIYKSISKNQTGTNERASKILEYRQQLARLKTLPLIQQRTAEWYEARKSRLTASDLEEALGNNNVKLAKKKAGIIKDTTNYANIPPLKWGTMFEAMAARCYSQLLGNIPIHEFGLIADTNLEHFGASPDGINDMGIMIEIKCPYSREIKDNNMPHKYYMQIQGQLAVCNLGECDYIECDFITYENVFKYIDDIYNTYANQQHNHGIIAEYKNKDTEEYFYLYSAAGLTASQAHEDIKKQQMLQEGKYNLTFIKLTPWRLRQILIQRVTFDPELWRDVVPKINAFWETVENCKKLPVEEVVKKPKITFIEEDD